jgi:hypothetical protein
MPRERERTNVHYKVHTDPNNFTLVGCYTTAKGKERETNIGFFSTLEKLREYAVSHLLRVEGLGALTDVEFKLQDLFNHHTKTPVPKKIPDDEDGRYKLPDEYEDALAGECMLNGNYIYRYEDCLEVLINHHGMSEEEAVDYFNYNILGTVGEGYPIYIY